MVSGCLRALVVVGWLHALVLPTFIADLSLAGSLSLSGHAVITPYVRCSAAAPWSSLIASAATVDETRHIADAVASPHTGTPNRHIEAVGVVDWLVRAVVKDPLQLHSSRQRPKCPRMGPNAATVKEGRDDHQVPLDLFPVLWLGIAQYPPAPAMPTFAVRRFVRLSVSMVIHGRFLSFDRSPPAQGMHRPTW